MPALREVVRECMAVSEAAPAAAPLAKHREVVRAYLLRLHNLRIHSMGQRAWHPEVLDWLRHQDKFIEQASARSSTVR